MEKQNWPSWRYGPKGEADVFASASDVPAGWKEHPSEFGGKPAPAAAPMASTSTASPTPPAAPVAPVAPVSNPDIDRDGHPWSADLHASSKSRTKDDLWRMKVGVSRPAPLEGYPKPAAPAQPLDL